MTTPAEPDDEEGVPSPDQDGPPKPGEEPPAPPDEPRTLGQQAVGGAAVTMAAQLAKVLIQVLAVVTLARLLTPQDFGLIAMVMAVIGVADTFRDFGLSSAAIQAPTLSRAQQSNLFWVNTGLGLLMAAITCACAPLVAMVFGRPELTVITLAMSASFLINGMATQYRADLYRRMMFKHLAVADTVGPLSGLVAAIVTAVLGGAFWALVAQQLVTITVVLAILLMSARWVPRLWRRDTPVREFVGFGWRLAGSQLVGYLGNNIDTVVLGLRVSASQLGIYNRAYQLIAVAVNQFRGPISTVAIPVLSRLQRDEVRYHRVVATGQLVLGYTLVVALAVASGAAEPAVSLLLGSQWAEAGPIVRLLAVGSGLQLLAFVGYWVYVSKGLVGHLLKYSFISTAIRVVFVVTGSFFGLMGVAWAMALSPLVAWPLSFWWLSRRASIPIRDLWLGGIRIVVFCGVIGVVSGAAQWASRTLPDIAQLGIAGLASAAGYALLALVPVFRRDIVPAFRLVQQNLSRRKK